MCAISSIYRYDALHKDDVSKIKGMNHQMAYRGPDGEGYWNNDNVAMGHMRLDIIGLDNGTQPLYNSDKSTILICNGEIFNYKELKDQLHKNGFEFRTDSDSEVILYLYELYGEACVQHLRGMFAFCLYDTNMNKIIVARDRMGQEWLYYAEIPGGVVFSSELKAILKYYIANPQLNIPALLSPLRYVGGTNHRDTFIEQIKRVEPGEIVVVNSKGLTRKHYWKLHRTYDFMGSIEDAKKETLRHLEESIELNMRSDVPVAIMLSGGVDSSAIAAIAKRLGHDVNTITTGYAENFSVDERSVAKRFAEEQGFHYNEVVLTREDYRNSFEELVSYMDEPVVGSTMILQWAMSKKLKEMGFKVLLGGEGGDELFYGYPPTNQLAEEHRLIHEHVSLFPLSGIQKKFAFLSFMRKHWKWLLSAKYTGVIEENAYSPWLQRWDYAPFINNASLKINGISYDLNEYDIYKGFPPCKLGKEIDTIYDFAIRYVMQSSHLHWAERMSMGNSIELRSPLLDHVFVEHVMSLPLNYKYIPGKPKQYFKDVLSGIVPDYILYAPKRGFSSPNEYIQDIVNNYQYKHIQSDYKYYGSIFADAVLDNLLNGHEK